MNFIKPRQAKTAFCSLLILASASISAHVYAEEMVIGEELIAPGINLIFEGAVKDHIAPDMQHLPIDETDVHLEARVNWAEKDIPEGAPPGGFVAYARVDAHIRNEKTGRSFHASLTPHVNLIDNQHYARNVALPGEANDLYTVVFYVRPPATFQLSPHKDWIDEYGELLFEPVSYEYNKLNFEDIVKASR